MTTTLLDEILAEAGFDMEAGLEGEDAPCRGFEIDERDYVRWVQRSLNRLLGAGLPVDGRKSPAYEAAVRRFQGSRRIAATGDVDAATQNRLILANETHHGYVEWVQRALVRHGASLAATGRKGSATTQAIRDFQRSRHPDLCVDGFVGAKTDLLLRRPPGVPPPGPRPVPPPVPVRPPKRREIPGPRVEGCPRPGAGGDERIRTTNAIRSRWAAAVSRLTRARARLRRLATLPPLARSRAWNRGPERTWFGVYTRGALRQVSGVLDRAHARLTSGRLVIRCQRDARGYAATSGLRPDELVLRSAWFDKPAHLTAARWSSERVQTFVHEAAHLVGVRRTIFAELYEPEPSRRLARRNPLGARRNADNYGYYVMAAK